VAGDERETTVSIQLKRPEQLQTMRDAGRIVAETLQILKGEVRPGITTGEIDAIAEKNIRRHGAVPSFKHYRGFPASTCISVNDEVVHGIPGKRVLNDGDIVSIDTGARYRGYHGDATITVPVGNISDETAQLVRVCFDSLDLGIAAAQVGHHLTDISAAIQDFVEAAGFSVVRDLYGHGIGRALHEEPMLPHYGPPGHGPVLRPGMVITIEPMIVAGRPATKTLRDNWTVVTLDGSWAAQFVHTVAITEDGPEVLTKFP
jgi:methionyl aminopeptidase